jgi:DNA polymerase-1
VVNSIIQGSAADIVKLAMCKWDDWVSAQGGQAQGEEAQGEAQGQGQGGRQPPARLVAQIHDELLFEVVDRPEAVQAVAGAVRRAMEGAVALDVPLTVNISFGSRWGSMGPTWTYVPGGGGGCGGGVQ